MQSAIKAISYHLPFKAEDNEVLSQEFPEWPADKISQKTGINVRHIAGHNECASDLGVASAQRLFVEHGISATDVDFILFCTQTPDYFLPTTACLIQHRLGIPPTAGALDFNLGCSGYIYGLGLAKGLIETGQAKTVLLITAETYSKFIAPKDKAVRSLFGDAAASTLVTVSNSGSINSFVYGTDGSGGEHLIVKAGGLRQPILPYSPAISSAVGSPGDKHLFMNGPEIFSFTLRVVPKLVESILKKGGLEKDRIDYYVFHQANKFMIDALRKKLMIAPEKFCECLADCGNTVSSTIPIAIYHALKDGRIRPGQRIMLVGFGVGLSWGGCIVQL